jgi:hypothetical protein
MLFIALIILSFLIKPYWKTQEEKERKYKIARDQRKEERDQWKEKNKE